MVVIATTWHELDIIHQWLQTPGWCWLIQRASEDNTHIEEVEFTNTGEDNIKIFDIRWNDISPTGEEFRELMKNAANVIDECIASRL
ncbi:MAG: hypothetical protein IH964_09265 [Candidatus Dadabacteria bacterium]|nr:hypothetical protein [Candidatus Dadabacteria bacterium]